MLNVHLQETLGSAETIRDTTDATGITVGTLTAFVLLFARFFTR